MRRCSRCILPETYPGITFNKDRVCNHCLKHRNRKPRGEAALKNLIEPYRNSGREYDCMVAVSGGRDSSFAAYYAVKVLGLRALCYTFDNGFMPEQTRENIENMTSVLGMDHVIETSDQVIKNVKHVISCWIHKPSPAMIGLLCNGCRTGYNRGLAQTVRDYQIPLVITGSGEPERSFAQRLLSTTHSRGKKLPLISGLVGEVIQNPCYISDPGFIIRLAREFSYRFLSPAHKRVKAISAFKFIGWSEKDILAVIQKELKWKKPSYSSSSWRADCAINELKNFLYLNTLGFSKHDELLSGMIRRGMMTREQALERLRSDNVISRQFLAGLFAELGLNLQDLDTALQKHKETWYPGG